MKCRNYEKKMILSLSNDLDPHEQEALEAHLKDCPACVQKYEEIKKDLKWMAGVLESRPEFDWDKSWGIIRNRLTRNKRMRETRIFQFRRIVQAAAILGIFLLGIVIGRYFLLNPKAEPSLQSNEMIVASRLIQQHLEETKIALLEYDNRIAFGSEREIFDFEKQRARILLFRNRALQAFLISSGDPSVIELLQDLEIILYEAANLETSSSKSHMFIKTLIKDKDIFFRIRQIGLYYMLKTEKEENL